jgi:hypothetical protein
MDQQIKSPSAVASSARGKGAKPTPYIHSSKRQRTPVAKPPFALAQVGHNRWKVSYHRRAPFECDSAALSALLRQSDITEDQRRLLFRQALRSMRRGTP